MTRQQFLDEVNDFDDLFRFCYDNGYEDALEDICSQDALDEDVEQDIGDYLRSHSWRDLRDALEDIPRGYDYYRCTGWLEYEGVDYEFEDYKNYVLSACDRNGDWEEEDEEEQVLIQICEEEEAYNGTDEEEEPVPDEEFSVQVLIQICGRRAEDYAEELRKKQDAQNEAFNGFVNSYAAKNKLPEPTSWR